MNRPRQGWSGLNVVTIFLVFATLMATFIGTLLIFPGKLLDVAGGAAAGIQRRRKWGWWLAVLLFSVNGLGDAISVFVTGKVLQGGSGVVIAGLFVSYLMRPAVRREFGDRSSPVSG